MARSMVAIGPPIPQEADESKAVRDNEARACSHVTLDICNIVDEQSIFPQFHTVFNKPCMLL